MKNDLTLAIFGKKKLSETATLAEHLDMLNELNLINIGELAELAISKTSKVDRCDPCTPGVDLVNGVEIKHGQTRSIQGNTRRSWISKKNKTGPIFAVITELKTKKQYYFRFPQSYYREHNANAICVPFELCGTPRRKPLRVVNYQSPWDFEVGSYKELCELAKNEGLTN